MMAKCYVCIKHSSLHAQGQISPRDPLPPFSPAIPFPIFPAISLIDGNGDGVIWGDGFGIQRK